MVAALRAEWLKQKRSLALALVILCGLFVPAITLLLRLHRPERLPALYRSARFWESLWHQAWQPMAVMLLPLGVALLVTLLVQIEYRHNTWKQVHAAPLPPALVFLAKLLVTLALVAAILVAFDLALGVVALVPRALHNYIPAPPAAPPWRWLLARNVAAYLTVLPVVALQFLLGLRYRNFMVPLGVGVALWLAAVLGLSSEYCWLLPYGYGGLEHLASSGTGHVRHLPADLRLLALVAFALGTGLAFALYVTQKERG